MQTDKGSPNQGPLDKGRMIVLGTAVVSIVVWMTIFPIILKRGPAGAYSGEESGRLCIAGGEAFADTDIVRFVRRLHYLGVRSEVQTGANDELCFQMTLARRIPDVADAILRQGTLQAFPIAPDQTPLFPEGDALAAGLERNTTMPKAPEWSATSTAPVHKLIDRVKGALPGVARPYCRNRRCTAILLAPELVVGPKDVMAAFPINTEAGVPSLLLRLTPPALQRITALAGESGVNLGFVIDGKLVTVAKIPPPKADGQVTIPLDRNQPDVEFEAAILASILSSGPIDGKWRIAELRLPAKSEMK